MAVVVMRLSGGTLIPIPSLLGSVAFFLFNWRTDPRRSMRFWLFAGSMLIEEKTQDVGFPTICLEEKSFFVVKSISY